ncbi:pentatricopeptide repeat-containing protein At2g17525, mitochondrial [Eucalyptus grandis]|uniref:pentatricopeptide repeat-containing protein At2g17525, mitochondrial n=1 Tax=Eucalyptus grandis TaxID=71139 RepID=UPI00192F10B4|nr:pentatricopeptide repeat-containing protein At2g17525, mitochondrial [Eucalyptus grandis]
MPKFLSSPKASIFFSAHSKQRFLLTFHPRPISSSSSSSSPHSSTRPFSPVPSDQHVARLILDQKTPSLALETFEWASKIPNFTHSQSTYRALIHKLCAFRRFDTAQQLLDGMPSSIGSPPDESIFLTIVRGLGRARRIREAIKVLDSVRKFGEEPSLKVYNAILDVLVKEDIDLAREFYRAKMMEGGVQGDEYTFGILMKGLCLTNRIAEGFKLLQAMKSGVVKPNTVIYNTLLHALCKNGKVGRARSLMNEMEEPNDVTFNILISGYCNEENLVQALVLLEKSLGSGFVPDAVTVTKVLRLLCSVGRVMEAVDVLERVENKGGPVDVVAYNTLVKGFCGIRKVKVGQRLLEEMERKGCLPNADTYNLLISGYCDSGMMDLALDTFNDMKTDGISWNFATFDALIRGLCSGGRTDEGFKILELMEENKSGSGGRITPYNSILYGLYKENRPNEALEFMIKMERLFPRTVDRCLKILGLCREGRSGDAKMVYDQMIGEGGFPNVLVYGSLIHGLSWDGNVRDAFELMNEMIGQGYFPVASTFNALISGLCRQGKIGSALKLIEDVIKRGCKPNAESYRPLVDAFCRKGDPDMGFKLLSQMVEMGIAPDHSIWNSLLLSFSREATSSMKDGSAFLFLYDHRGGPSMADEWVG